MLQGTTRIYLSIIISFEKLIYFQQFPQNISFTQGTQHERDHLDRLLPTKRVIVKVYCIHATRIQNTCPVRILGDYDDFQEGKGLSTQVYATFSSYLQEFQPLGTVGGLYHFRDQIMLGNPDALIVLYADISSDFPLKEMWEFHKAHNHGKHTVLGTEVFGDEMIEADNMTYVK